ncbi:MAG: Bifunctional protein pyrR [Candidatus Moanabacter tarae]|uniref:Bifunctional protein pyrR n=1 Tax=Candidatus Moanibacter tarae TaxID=2200854 RepID=A0A2Z4ADG4_9BACT|nr:MAG: Bifunctional protein pyrR [Candidatus Moanabacter tarae]|tara:strand:- start:9677 stop:10213 length:537 start_codon:yes stop_codon:yes gene_type:complete
MKEIKRIESQQLTKAINRIVASVYDQHYDTEDLVIIGIANGGIAFSQILANCLGSSLNKNIACGTVNISFHRDDIERKPIPRSTNPTSISFDIEGSHIILADDVIFSGRSVRAAINEIFDIGRPAMLELAILCDRGNRRLSIQPNYLGFEEKLTPQQKIEVHMNPINELENSLVIFDR